MKGVVKFLIIMTLIASVITIAHIRDRGINGTVPTTIHLSTQR